MQFTVLTCGTSQNGANPQLLIALLAVAIYDHKNLIPLSSGPYMDNKPPVTGNAPMQKVVAELERRSTDFATRLMAAFVPEIVEQLSDMADRAKNNDQAWHLLQLSRDIKQRERELSSQFNGGIAHSFQAYRQGTLGKGNSVVNELSSDLSLLANDELEQDLAATALARKVETRSTEILYALNQRMAVVNGGKKLQEDSNPISAYQFAKALQDLTEHLKLDTRLSILFFRLFERILLEMIPDYYQGVNEYLIRQNILPNMRYGRGQNPAASSTADNTPKTEPAPAEAEKAPDPDMTQQQLLEAIQNLQKMQQELERKLTGNTAANDAVSPGPVVPLHNAPIARIHSDGYQPGFFSQPGFTFGGNAAVAVCQPQELVTAVTAVPTAQLATQLDQHIVSPMTVEQFQAVTVSLQKQLGDNKRIDDGQGRIIDTVGMIFEYILSDRQLPDPVKAVLSYLHTPYLKVALVASQLLDNPGHPSRRLLDALAEAGGKWVTADGNSQFKAFPKIKSIVRRIVTEFKNDITLFDELLADMTEFNQKVANNIALVERRTREKAEGEERLREVKQRVLREVRQRMQGYALPSPIIVLLLQPWSDFLTFTLLRHGEESMEWQESLNAVNDIIWSIQPKADMSERNRLIMLQETIQTRVQEGLETIAYDQGKTNKMLDALHKSQMLSLENMAAEPAAPEKRAEMESQAVQDVGGQEDEQQEILSQAEAELVEKLRTIEFGTWIEFDQIDEHVNQHLKVAWFNARTSRYVLIDRSGKQAATKTGAEIARLMLAGHARIAAGSAKPFFDRALENILARMSAAVATDQHAPD